jgi:transmembrane sensor
MVLKQEDLEQIKRYIRGEASDIEKDHVESFFLDGENNPYLRQSLEKDWDSILVGDTGHEVDLSHLLDRIHHSIRRIESERMQKPLKKFIRIYSKIAASLILPVLLSGLAIIGYLNQRYNSALNEKISTTIFAPMGSRVTFDLPDGTKGFLNSGSRLSYTLPFIGKRKLKLEGEAWFEVKHDEKHPFIIAAGNSTVKVVGTSFNLSSYPHENYIEVVLKEGKVDFFAKKNDNKVTIQPSERLVFQKGQIRKTIVDPAKYEAWTEGKLVFRSDPMAEVARRIERWYNINIVIEDRELDKYTFRATFQDDKLEDVLKYLSLTSPISYKIIPRKILPDSTLQKKKVLLYKNN